MVTDGTLGANIPHCEIVMPSQSGSKVLSQGTYHYIAGATGTTNVNVTTTAASSSFAKDWQRTNNYSSKRRRGEKLPNLPFNYSFRKTTHATGRMALYYRPNTSANWEHVESAEGCLNPPSGYSLGLVPPYSPSDFPDSGLITSLHDELNRKLLQKIKDQKINLAQMYAERAQTAQLVTQAATRIASSFQMLRKGNLVGAVNRLTGGPVPGRVQRQFQRTSGNPFNQVASTWLELQYGWKPLLSDVYNSAEVCAKANLEPKLLDVASASGSRDPGGVVTQDVDSDLGNNAHRKTIDYATVSATQRVRFEVTNSAARSMSQLGVSNPLALAWEVLPYSFVVDWFFPIGSFLSSIDATSGCSLVSSIRNTKWKHRLEYSWAAKSTQTTSGYNYQGSANGSIMVESVHREVLTSWPSNALPSFQNPFSFTHVANALSLLKLAFK